MDQQKFSVPVDHVSDTAYLVSAYRLMESKRNDRHFDDSIAEKLLGDEGHAILDRFPVWALGAWTMTVRTTLIDRLILKLVDQGLDTVVNLAAGLDTRPYRLALPKTLNWIEADLEGIIKHKNKKLADESPHCLLKRLEVDLSSKKDRDMLFTSFKDLGRVIVLTEGLLMYLDPQDVHALSDSLLENSNVKAWLTDIATPASIRAMYRISNDQQTTSPSGKEVHFNFLPDEGLNYFEALGWTVNEFYSYLEYGKTLNRDFPIDIQPHDLNDMSQTGFGVLNRKI